MKASVIIATVLSIFICVPINVYLWYKVLSMIQTTELMWFLWYANIPIGILCQLIFKFATKEK
jgi:hypothetical protein